MKKKLRPHFSQTPLFLWDAFKAQTTDLVNVKLDELNIERVMVPKNVMYLLQPLDLTTNEAMKIMENSAVKNVFANCMAGELLKDPAKRCNYHRC